MQKSSAIASIFGVMEFRTLVYGIGVLQIRVHTGNLHPNVITDLHVVKISKG